MTRARIGLIWAQAQNGVIGRDGVMPWHIPEDLAHFKATTLGSAVVMGRKTWDSLPEQFRPLEGRRNIVVTRQSDWHADGVEVAHSLEEALELADASSPTDDEAADAANTTDADGAEPRWIWVIGGAEIYNAALAMAERIEVTEIRTEIPGDAFAPAIPESWRVADRDPLEGWRTSRTGVVYRFIRYTPAS